MKSLTIFIAIVYLSGAFAANQSINITLGANAWVTSNVVNATETIDTSNGLINWQKPETIVSVYFYVTKPGLINVSMVCYIPSTLQSVINLTIDNTTLQAAITGNQSHLVYVGQFSIQRPGYVKLDLQGVNKTGTEFGRISNLTISGELVDSQSIGYIPDQPVSSVYWNRRRSLGLWHPAPSRQFNYFYHEMSIVPGYDPSGSYFMPIGWNNGYFGMEIRSGNKRTVRFAVFDNVSVISVVPGGGVSNVYDPGSPGKSVRWYYQWSSGTTYKFLVNAKPDPQQNQTTYTGWWGELNGDWKLIGSFLRYGSSEYLTGVNSFNECYQPEYDYLTRKALYGNQWYYSLSGKWVELTNISFVEGLDLKPNSTNLPRIDFEGGVLQDQNQQKYYLEAGGFFNAKPGTGKILNRTANNIPPNIDFNSLPLI